MGNLQMNTNHRQEPVRDSKVSSETMTAYLIALAVHDPAEEYSVDDGEHDVANKQQRCCCKNSIRNAGNRWC